MGLTLLVVAGLLLEQIGLPVLFHIVAHKIPQHLACRPVLTLGCGDKGVFKFLLDADSKTCFFLSGHLYVSSIYRVYISHIQDNRNETLLRISQRLAAVFDRTRRHRRGGMVAVG